jgi:hypothetical protein
MNGRVGSEGHTSSSSHGSTGDETALDELVRVSSHDLSILASPGLTLVSVDDQVSRPIRPQHTKIIEGASASSSYTHNTARHLLRLPWTAYRPSLLTSFLSGLDSGKSSNEPLVLLPPGLVHEAPLETRGEASASSTSETRGLDGVDDPGIALEQDLLCLVPVPSFLHRTHTPHQTIRHTNGNSQER